MQMNDPTIGHVLPVGGPVLPDYVVGRTGEIDQLVTRLSESVHTMASGDRRIGKTTICDAACARLKPQLEIVRIEVPERRDADARVFLQLIIDRCNTISHAAATRKLLRAARPAIETVLGSAGIPMNLDELGAEPAASTAREILALPRTLADELGKPVVFFLDELQRAVDYTDGAEILEALVDLYSGGVGDVVVLVDGSDDRLLDRMRGAPIQFDKLCDRLAITASIPKQIWREALPGRFEQLSITIEPAALEAIVEFGAERPYATMAAAQGAALAARRINVGAGHATVGAFEADQGIELARRRLADDV
jgi:AAA ATPase domain